jgi:hypothetical protein
MSFDRKKNRTRSFNRKFIWPKVHLTESFFWKWSFDRKVIGPKVHLTESFSREMVIWLKGHLTECFFCEKLSFSKNFYLTDCSYSIRIVHVPNFFVTARHRERKKLFLYCHYYYSNRVENIIKVTDCYELEN